ncbi:hypothetical protein ACNHKD_11770 [Methylocystis sp. JAN1]|uniref:hypothetical protein n=1 Tax=Methylocystis sp. JAN1 TaxID=3397211 RepID=UPI003FA2B14F
MFWLIGERNARRNAELWDNETGYYEKHNICPLDPHHGILARRWGPAKFREEPKLEGMSPLDRSQDAFSTPRSSFVFTRRVFAALEEAKLTGWLMNPATVSFADGTVSTDFGELWINGFGGVAPLSTGCKLLWRCRGCGLSEYQGAVDFMKRAEFIRRTGVFVEARGGFDFGQAIKQARWDGSDFFIIWPLMNFPICTDRAKVVMEQFRIDKIQFKKPEEIEPIECYGDTAVPPYYKPEARAEIEAYWAEAPVWPDDFEKPAP